MTVSSGRPGRGAATLLGAAASFVAGERMTEAFRPALLLDPDPSWAAPRFLLWLALLCATVSAGVLAAALFFVWSRSRLAPGEPRPLPFRTATLVVLAVAALAAGGLFRFFRLDSVPGPLWVDDVSLIAPTLALEGTWKDFSNSIRPAPYGVETAYGSVGVLYLELYRACLTLAGTTVLGVRLPSAVAGTLSVATAMLLGRALLPAGGGVLAGLILAGLRWSLILSRWGWVAIVVAPILDLAALALIWARRRRSAALAVAAGLLAGLATHVYLSAWIGVVALLVFALWPLSRGEGWSRRMALGIPYALAAAVAAAPLFLLDEGRKFPYFARASDHNVALEIRMTKSALPPFGAAADALASPWLLDDPTPRHDIPGRSRLGWIVGVPVAFAFAFAILHPRRELSAFLLAHAAAAVAAAVVSGRAQLPNGFRFAYLTSTTAVAAAGGALIVLGTVREGRRRITAVALAGLLAIASATGARDLLAWAHSRATFDGFEGQDTLIGRAAARWDRYGVMDLDPALGKSPLTVAGVRRYRLDPWARDVGGRERWPGSELRGFRIVAPGTPPQEGERLVEKVSDGWGREWAWVYGKRDG